MGDIPLICLPYDLWGGKTKISASRPRNGISKKSGKVDPRLEPVVDGEVVHSDWLTGVRCDAAHDRKFQNRKTAKYLCETPPISS